MCIHSPQYLYQIPDKLEFPLALDMSPYTSHNQENTCKESDDVYHLTSVVIHEGTPTVGHYYCLVRPDPLNAPEKWVKFNDRAVTEIPYEEMQAIAFGGKSFKMPGFGFGNRGQLGSCNAYILQYCKEKLLRL